MMVVKPLAYTGVQEAHIVILSRPTTYMIAWGPELFDLLGYLVHSMKNYFVP